MNDSPTKVTILMPVYNGEAYLRTAIDSILTQTYPDFEFLIIDDGSTDNSSEIIRSYQDERIRYISNSENLGINKTLNKGIRLAKGKYIARMDSDDISLPHRIAKQVEFMDTNINVAICGSWVQTYGNNNSLWKYPVSDEEIRCNLLFESALAHPSIIMRRSIFSDGSNFYNESSHFRKAQDYELWTRVSKKYALANIPAALLHYRQHEINLEEKSKNTQASIADTIREQQLKSFRIDFSPDELTLHCKIARWAFEPTLQFVDAAGAWLSKIAMTNKINNFYNPDLLNIILATRWWQVCLHATSLGIITLRRFKQHPLQQYASPPAKKLIIFTIKCLIKRGSKLSPPK